MNRGDEKDYRLEKDKAVGKESLQLFSFLMHNLTNCDKQFRQIMTKRVIYNRNGCFIGEIVSFIEQTFVLC